MPGLAAPVCLLAASIGMAVMFASRPAPAPGADGFHETGRIVASVGSPRRPPPASALPVYYERPAELDLSRQGTGFVIAPQGVWATAAHVTDRCGTIRFLVDQRTTPPVATPAVPLGQDISLITGGIRSPMALSLSGDAPRAGAVGYHMGFPMGTPGLIGSRLLGRTSAVRHGGQTDAVLAWVEDGSAKNGITELDGLSGGPVLDDRGQVVGIVSMASERRGRILTAMPAPVRRWLAAQPAQPDAHFTGPIANRSAALSFFQFLINNGFIRQLYCDVAPRYG
ncbi:hypothetical protein ASE00_04880 [Sphingomonas sp. Root710]|uniref:S1 family peptidase n=1 Tax=Sphingomonas sp. Root710 TaxID=1736594 RepID=UPI0007004736|nr:serine protease [Sphingomonas sp. Root710]KRB86078.1 hypothetical protein ASE00_04880 [Sphingomonas sp. Root710]